MKTKYFKETKAITLIALVVTIVVLLILAGVSIAVLTGENGILNRASQAKKTNEDSEVMENIRLAYNNAQIGKHSGANEVFEDKMDSDLELTYGEGSVSVSKEEDIYVVTITGRGTYEILADGNVRKQGANIEITGIAFKDASGNEITTRIQGEGTVYIHFIASLRGGNISSVTSENLTPILTSEEWVTPVTANGTYTFTIIGSVDNETKTKNQDIIVNKFSNLPSGLKVGAYVHYSPSGRYTWKAKYASSKLSITKKEGNQTVEDDLNDVLMSSEEGENFNLTEWKILNIDEDKGELQIVPNESSTAKVGLQGPQGYNNSVKLLNDACRELYSMVKDGTTIASARSINIEDIEQLLNSKGIERKNSFHVGWNDNEEKVYLGNTFSTPYSFTNGYSQFIEARDENGNYIKWKDYPSIYKYEENSIIDNVSTNGTLKLSEQMNFIERIDENLMPIEELITATNSTRPMLSYYILSDGYKEAYWSCFKEYEEGKTYAELLLTNTANETCYWIASRYIKLDNAMASFGVFNNLGGYLSNVIYDYAYKDATEQKRCLFPIVTVSLEHISQKGGVFEVD